jgi:hypothetical protein
MRKKILALTVFLALSGSILVGTTFAQPRNISFVGINSSAQVETGGLIFSDSFDGAAINSTKWVVQENTQMNDYPAFGGSVSFSGGSIFLTSDGSSFPSIETKANPFPTTGDFAVEFTISYTMVNGRGNGFWISKGEPFRNAGALPGAQLFNNCVFAVWADSHPNHTYGHVNVYLLGKPIRTYTFSSSTQSNTSQRNDVFTSDDTYNFGLSYNNGSYTAFMNKTILSSESSTQRPDTIGFGHPECAWVPLMGAQPSVTPWTRFKIDSINVYDISSQIEGTPAPTETQPDNSTGLSTHVSFSTRAESSQLGFSIDINGTIVSQTEKPLFGANVLLSYRIPGVQTWNIFTSVTTDAVGAFSVTWLPTATGNFIIKAEYTGNATYLPSTDTKNISVVRGTAQSLLYAESNSTLSSIDINSTSNEVSFTVSGSSGTTGYVKFLISKTLLPNATELEVYLDGQLIGYEIAPIGDLQSLYFDYGHSTHTVNMKLSVAAPIPEVPTWTILPLMLTLAAMFFATATVRLKRLRRN